MQKFPDLSETDMAVYQVHVTTPSLSACQISELLGLPVERVEEAKEMLRTAQLLQPALGDGWVAVSPDTAADILLADAEQAMLDQNSQIAAVRARLGTWTVAYLEARSMRSVKDRIEVIEGIDGIRAVIDDLARTCEKSIDAMVPGGGQSVRAIKAAIPLDLATLERGVAIRTLFQHAARNHRATTQYAETICAGGAQVRSTSLLPSRMLIYDDAAAVIPLDQENTAAGAVVIRDPAVLRLLSHLFTSHWERAIDFAAYDRQEDNKPTDLELAVLRLMAAGKKDEAIARQIGLSGRSTSRVIAGIMERLEATNRFQAGVRATLKGWLP
ncbi:helix-turn-helix transcriptional regulator [Streptomyces sp. NPDC051133]|uniref:helix-turn-helix transcriptional regulator n=1 Tax=Streptomyces sp. NPDC051133 TaxID=3155521 RepID=UPI0034358837